MEIILGISNIITGALLTLSNTLEYQKKEAQHRTTAELYDTIRTRLNLKCMEYNPSFNYDRFFSDIESQIEQNKSRCKVMVPNVLEKTCNHQTLQTFRSKLTEIYEQQLATEQHRTQMRDLTLQSIHDERVRVARDMKNLKELNEINVVT